MIRGIPAMILLSAPPTPSPAYPVASRSLFIWGPHWYLRFVIRAALSYWGFYGLFQPHRQNQRTEKWVTGKHSQVRWLLKREKEKPLNILLQILQGHKAQISLQRLCFSLPPLSPPSAVWVMAVHPLHLSSGPTLAYSSLLPFLRKAFLISILKLISSGNAD